MADPVSILQGINEGAGGFFGAQADAENIKYSRYLQDRQRDDQWRQFLMELEQQRALSRPPKETEADKMAARAHMADMLGITDPKDRMDFIAGKVLQAKPAPLTPIQKKHDDFVKYMKREPTPAEMSKWFTSPDPLVRIERQMPDGTTQVTYEPRPQVPTGTPMTTKNEPVDKDAKKALVADMRALNQLADMKKIFDSIMRGVPKEDWNKPFTLVANRVKGGLYGVGFKTSLTPLIDRSQRFMLQGAKALAGGRLSGPLIALLAQHYPDATTTPAQFAQQFKDMLKQIDDDARLEYASSNMTPQELEDLKKKNSGAAFSAIGGETTGHSSQELFEKKK